jgi:hypothetical protein
LVVISLQFQQALIGDGLSLARPVFTSARVGTKAGRPEVRDVPSRFRSFGQPCTVA